MFKMKWLLLVVCVFLAANTVSSKPTQDNSPPSDYEEDMLKDEEGGVYATGDDDDENIEDDEENDDDSNVLPPVIKSLPQTVTAPVGGTVELPCVTENADVFSVMWRKNGAMIYQDNIKIGGPDVRYQRFLNQTLQIAHLEEKDAGDYECSISTSPKLTVVSHKLIITFPAAIVNITTRDGFHEIKRGSPLDLFCDTTGNPTPKVTWSKNGNRIATHTNRAAYFVDSVDASHSGVYVCMAENELNPEPVVKALDISVIYAPDMRVDTEVIGDSEIRLVCKVHAHPKAEITWIQNNKAVTQTSNVKMEHSKHQKDYIIKISDVDESNFGNYSCRASNKLGHMEKHLSLSATPAVPKYTSQKFVGEDNDLLLNYTVTSFSPISAHELQYRLKEKGTTWITESPAVENVIGYSKSIKHVLKKLDKYVYEVRIRSENEYGWSDFSRPVTVNGKTPEDADSITQKEPVTAESAASPTMFSYAAVLLTSVMCLYSTYV